MRRTVDTTLPEIKIERSRVMFPSSGVNSISYALRSTRSEVNDEDRILCISLARWDLPHPPPKPTTPTGTPSIGTSRRRRSAWDVPGLAIAVVKDDAIVFERGYGTTSLANGSPVNEHTLFSIGSTTKAMTAAALGMLVDEGKLGWDDPVSEHLPRFRLADAEASAQTPRPRPSDPQRRRPQRRRPLVRANERPRRSPPADAIRRALRSHVLELHLSERHVRRGGQAARDGVGQSWVELIEGRIFAPLGMARSVATLARTDGVDNVATPHHYVDDELVPIDNASVDSVPSAGAVWSSVHDMALWARFLLRGCTTEAGQRLLAEATCAELFEPQAIVNVEMYPAMRLYEHHWFTYGLGWFQTDYNGRALDFHSGSIDGLVALHGLVRDEKLGVYILGNRDHAEVRHALMYRALDLYDDDVTDANRRDWSREVKELFDRLERERRDDAQRAQTRPTRGPRSRSTRTPATTPTASWATSW